MCKAQLLQLREAMATDPELTQLMFDFNHTTQQHRTASEAAHLATAHIADTNPAAYEGQLAAALHERNVPPDS